MQDNFKKALIICYSRCEHLILTESVKKILTIFFLVVISIQFLPVKEMGKCLFDNQFVEEEVYKKSIEKSASLEPGNDLINFDLSPQHLPLQQNNRQPRKTALHKPPITDIVTPPPNA